MVKPERGRALEDLIIDAARSGRLRGSSPTGQLTENDLVGLLENINVQQQSQESKIKFQRRPALDDEDEDF
jgi:DNA-binding TFAR19-related protein (PDSD5 family)